MTVNFKCYTINCLEEIRKSQSRSKSLLNKTMGPLTYQLKPRNFCQNIELTCHLPYTPDWVPNHFFSFPDIKKNGLQNPKKRFQSGESSSKIGQMHVKVYWYPSKFFWRTIKPIWIIHICSFIIIRQPPYHFRISFRYDVFPIFIPYMF